MNFLSGAETRGGGGGDSLIWAIRGCAAGQGMVFWPRCPEQGIQFELPLPYTGSEPEWLIKQFKFP